MRCAVYFLHYICFGSKEYNHWFRHKPNFFLFAKQNVKSVILCGTYWFNFVHALIFIGHKWCTLCLWYKIKKNKWPENGKNGQLLQLPKKKNKKSFVNVKLIPTILCKVLVGTHWGRQSILKCFILGRLFFTSDCPSLLCFLCPFIKLTTQRAGQRLQSHSKCTVQHTHAHTVLQDGPVGTHCRQLKAWPYKEYPCPPYEAQSVITASRWTD